MKTFSNKQKNAQFWLLVEFKSCWSSSVSKDECVTAWKKNRRQKKSHKLWGKVWILDFAASSKPFTWIRKNKKMQTWNGTLVRFHLLVVFLNALIKTKPSAASFHFVSTTYHFLFKYECTLLDYQDLNFVFVPRHFSSRLRKGGH